MSTPRPPLEDADVFCQLYLDTHQAIYRYIYAMYGGPKEEVDDLAAETFMRAWRSRARFQGTPEDAHRWLVGIARNLVIDTYRKKKARGSEVELDENVFEAFQTNPEEALIEQERMRKLWTALHHLPEQQREMVILRYVLGWPVKQVALHLGMLENTVSVYLKRTVERIRLNWPEE